MPHPRTPATVPRIAIHAPTREETLQRTKGARSFDPGEVLRRTGFRVRHETRQTGGELRSVGRGFAKLGAGDFASAGGNLALTVLAGLLGLILLDLLLSQRGSSITGAAIRWTQGALSRVVSPIDPLTEPGSGENFVVTPDSAATPSSPALDPGTAAGAGGYYNPLSGATFQRVDQGVDLKGKPGQSVIAIGDAKVDAVKADPGGFGVAIYYTLLSGPQAGQQIYVGHAQPLVKQGEQIAAGSPVARLLAHPLGNATEPGWTEIGFASNGAPANNGSAFKAFLGLLLGPPNTKTTTNPTGGKTTVTGP